MKLHKKTRSVHPSFHRSHKNFELSWKDVMILLSQTLTSLEKQQVPYQAAVAGDDYRLDKCDPTGLSQTGPQRRRRKTKTLHT
jgi:hypothetical protein